jgi:holo-[acyl-carrier protein] synthase
MSIIGLGTDIVEIARFDREPQRSKLAKRVLTTAEYDVYSQHAMPDRFLAKRFAAKEAAVKALGTGIGNGVSWQHIEISNDELGKPVMQLTGGAQDRAQQLGATHWLISIADEQHYAVATVVMSA